MTPEAFYRICDSKYEKTITLDQFRAALKTFKIQMSRGQLKRMELIFDEDMEGHITLQEFQDALEAYNQSGENHVSPSGDAVYTSFEHRCVFKLLSILKERDINKDEFYRSCDCDNNGEVDLKELESVLTGLTPEFYQKDS
jgi:Ca2+-binding EF-hand superfamily protein